MPEIGIENIRIKLVRKALGKKQEEFASSIYLTQGGYSDIERGKNGVTAKVKQALVEVHKVNMAWFEDGDGEMFFIDTPPDEPEAFLLNDLSSVPDTQSNLVELLNSELKRHLAERRLFLELLHAKDKTISALDEQLEAKNKMILLLEAQAGIIKK